MLVLLDSEALVLSENAPSCSGRFLDADEKSSCHVPMMAMGNLTMRLDQGSNILRRCMGRYTSTMPNIMMIISISELAMNPIVTTWA